MLILQETHSTPEIEKVWENEWGGKIFFSHGAANARGVAVLAKKEWKNKITNIYIDKNGRMILLDLVEFNYTISIAALYAPNEDDPLFFRNIATLLKERSEHKILIGDYNLVLDVELDRLNTYCNNQKAKEEILDMCDQYYLTDIWRIHHEDKKEYSWKKGSVKTLKASRIDFALVSKGIDQKVELTQYLSSIFTDHRAFYMVLDLNPFERGAGYWKFNCSLLTNLEFIQLLNQEIELTIESCQQKTARETWENIKVRIKKMARKYAAEKSAQNKLIIAQLSERLNGYEARLPLTLEEDKLMEETRVELEEKTLERIQGVMFRSKAKWYEEGEKNTKYFYSLEKAKYNAKTCYQMLDDKNNVLDTKDQILEHQRQFYSELYEKDDFVKFSLSNQTGITVPEEIRLQQDKQITMTDLAEAIKTMNNNKTPGQDGIPVDVYKVFWAKLQKPFYDMVIENYELEVLHNTARKGILNLIPKANKDTRLVKNLRPITLLNTDYKIIEKAIANKMLPALETIIHKDQRGFMKNRRISVNIRKMLDIIHSAEVEDLEAVVLSLDFVKCFDKCSFSILHGSLQYFGFGNIIRKWTEILYNNFTVQIQNNGNFSETIKINKGVHQGGCCSSLYFLVIAEILAIALRDNDKIHGITIHDIRNLLNQFADDMDIFSMCTEQSISNIYSELEAFRLQSGFTVSYEKTTLYRIGSLRHSSAQKYTLDQFNWSKEDITVLGVTIAHEDLMEKNYNTIIDKVKKTLSAWHNRDLSLLAKVQVVNTLVASLFVYKMMVLPIIPNWVVKKVDNMIREYIWKGRKAKIAYPVLQLPKQEGGQNLVNLEARDRALKATWPQILAQEKEYENMVYGYLRCKDLGANIWRCNLHPKDIARFKIKNQFWKDVLLCWSQFNYHSPKREENQIIWYNSQITREGKPFFWKDAYLKGLVFVHQLFEDKTFKKSEVLFTEFGLTPLRVNSLKSSLPAEWRAFFGQNDRSTFTPLPPHLYDLVITVYKDNLAKKIYSFFQEDIMLLHYKFIKWKQDLGDQACDFTLTDFRQEFRNIYKITNVPKYRSFQYKLLQRGIITNVQLEKWNILPSSLCSFCRKEEETVIHLFCTCPVVIEFWKQVYDLIQSSYCSNVVNFNTSVGDIVFNTIILPKNHIGNFVCLVAKQYIYASRCLGNQLMFPGFKSKIKLLENIEKYIAVKNNRLSTHSKKWAKITVSDESRNFISVENYVEMYMSNL